MTGFRYAKLFENDSRYRDAEAILRLQRLHDDLPTDKGKQKFDDAVAAYIKKHNEDWLNFVTAEERILGR